MYSYSSWLAIAITIEIDFMLEFKFSSIESNGYLLKEEEVDFEV